MEKRKGEVEDWKKDGVEASNEGRWGRSKGKGEKWGGDCNLKGKTKNLSRG